MRPQFQIQVSEPSPQGDVAYTRLISQRGDVFAVHIAGVEGQHHVVGREPRATKGYPDILF